MPYHSYGLTAKHWQGVIINLGVKLHWFFEVYINEKKKQRIWANSEGTANGFFTSYAFSDSHCLP